MKLLDQFGREVSVGDAVIPKDVAVQNWVITEIDKTELSPTPGQPPLVKVTFQCQLTMAIADMGQATQALPLFIVKKGEDAQAGKPRLVVMN